jgi:hypothetical protein
MPLKFLINFNQVTMNIKQLRRDTGQKDGRGGTRTHDLTDVNRALLPAELRAQNDNSIINLRPHCPFHFVPGVPLRFNATRAL